MIRVHHLVLLLFFFLPLGIEFSEATVQRGADVKRAKTADVPESKLNYLWKDEKGKVLIRVRVAESQKEIEIGGYGLRVDVPAAGGWTNLAWSMESSYWKLRCSQGRVSAIPIDKKKVRYRIEKQKLSSINRRVAFRTTVGFVSLGKKPYRGRLVIVPRGGSCDVVNYLDIEKYLEGLVNSEFSSHWDSDSIAAQVIAARSYAAYQMKDARKKKHSYYDLDSTVYDQVYNGTLGEDFKASKVVSATEGKILTLEKKPPFEPMKAFYHSTCGGHTETAQHVWGHSSPGVNVGVQCTYCQNSPHFKWQWKASREKITEVFKKGIEKEGVPRDWPGYWQTVLDQGVLLDVSAEIKSEENRVSEIRTLWAAGVRVESLKIPATTFRRWVGEGKFKSTSFDIVPEPTKKTYHFVGRGFGHGVGMCQYGAKNMGEIGFDAREILKHYYPTARIEKLW